jgi:EAL domain-containing protein (putative c-di-GMP-specific phosphodiesterase class I)
VAGAAAGAAADRAWLPGRAADRRADRKLAVRDLDLARNLVVSLKNQGVRLALDDFGTGFSSLSHLRMLPLDMIKIDRSFMATVHVDRESAAIVKAVTTLAQALGIPVTAEGLEDAATYDKAAALGARTGQGWFVGKPMDADAVARLCCAATRDGRPRPPPGRADRAPGSR